MGETGNKAAAGSKSKKSVKPSIGSRIVTFWKGVKAEFRKIIWPTKEALKKQTILVLVVSLVMSVFIKAFDTFCQYLVSFIR